MSVTEQIDGRWLLRAGSWVPRGVVSPIPSRITIPCVLLGCELGIDRRPTQRWMELLRQNGGVFRPHEMPPMHSLWLSDAAAAAHDLPSEMSEMVTYALAHGWPVFRHAALDVCRDERLRVLQAITSLQRGGAERLALNLHEWLPRHDVASVLLTLGTAGRATFPVPADVIARQTPPDAVIRSEEIHRALRETGADVLHGHLIDGDTLSRVDAAVPMMVTFHNQRLGWPEEIEKLTTRPKTLLLGCSQAVTDEMEAYFPQMQVRTVWNGISPPTPHAHEKGDRLRIAAVANPRPQKRLPMLMDVLALLPGARLSIAGEASTRHPDAQREVELCREKSRQYGREADVEWLGAVEDIPCLLARVDVFVSTSLHEGMSLAQLEAVACGVPVVCTDVGGASDIARRHPGMMRILPVDATTADFAAAIREMAPQRRSSGSLAPDFTAEVMAARHAFLAHAMLIASEKPRCGLMLVTNHFFTGGAQSSARRLLRHIGIPARAVVLQEPEASPGSESLRAAGIEVLSLSPTGTCDAAVALRPLLQDLAARPPQLVLFWNVIPEYKILLAEAMHRISVLDVSPGEMFFTSLERYFYRPRPGWPDQDAAAYGQRLSAVIVKHESELVQAKATLRCPVVRHIPNGVPLRSFQTEPEGTEWTLGTAARLHPHKRIEDLIAAFRQVHAQCPQARLRIAGGPDGGQEAYAEALRVTAQDLPIEWCGELSELGAFHDSVCLFVMISEPAGCPNASLEAMASSLPIIATDVGGAREQIEHGVNGLLVPARDDAALATAMLTLLHDAEKRASMRKAAHERAGRLFSIERMVADYRRVCDLE
ncbi:MAG: glycosyltransferase [Verrucomicrobiaceae bacterium]|nr:glycosyltransferase [Verrucomicrobiaceae bacterium]